MKRGLLLWLTMLLATSLWAQSDDEALVRLTSHLEAVRAEARGQRWLTGGLALGTGVLTASAGVSSALLIQVADGSGDDSWRQAQMVNAVAWGALYAGVGLAVLALPGSAETLPDRFDRMPASSDDERHQKRVAGEVALQSLADQGRTGRLWSAVLWGLAGGTALAWDLSWSQTDQVGRTGDPILYLGSSAVATAVVHLLLETGPERELRAYRQAGFLSRSDR